MFMADLPLTLGKDYRQMSRGLVMRNMTQWKVRLRQLEKDQDT